MIDVLLHDAIRPNRHRDDAGELGENMFALADDIEINTPELSILVAEDQPKKDAAY